MLNSKTSSRFNGFLRRFSRKIVSKEDIMGAYADLVSDETQKLMWALPGTYAVTDAVENVGESYGSNNPIRYVILTGSFSRRGAGLGHMENHEKLEEMDYKHILSMASDIKIKHHGDIDVDTIVKPNVSYRGRVDVGNRLKLLLPQTPDHLKEDFDGFDTQVIRTEHQLLDSFAFFERRQLTYLHHHELQIVDNNPEKEVVPTILYQSPHVNAVLKTRINKSVEKRCLRDHKTWISETWIPSIRPFKERFPERFDLMKECVYDMLDKGEFRIKDPTLIEEIKQQISNL